MGKHWILTILCVFTAITILIGLKHQHTAQTKLTRSIPPQFEIEQMMNDLYNKKSSFSQKIPKKYKQIQNSSKSQNKKIPQVQLFVSNVLSDIISLINSTLKDHPKLNTFNYSNKTFFVQEIDFTQQYHFNFTSLELLSYKVFEFLRKYTYGLDEPQVQIKIFDLRRWNTTPQRQHFLLKALESIKYLMKYETGKLFWFESATGIMKSHKLREQQSEIQVFIVLGNDVQQEELMTLKQQVKNYASQNNLVMKLNNPLTQKKMVIRKQSIRRKN